MEHDYRLDLIKGGAAVLVVLCHIIQNCFEGYESSFFFNIIWSLQIPLFIIVSGYLSSVKSRGLLQEIKKKLMAYLLPFISWTILALIIFCNNTSEAMVWLDDLAFHVDKSLWFMLCLFFISCIHSIAVYSSSRIERTRSTLLNDFIYIICFGVCLIPWLIVAYLLGTSFLGAKYVLYYSIFFILGQFGKRWSAVFHNLRINKCKLMDIITALCIVLYIFICSHYSLHLIEDNLMGIAVRFISSCAGCWIVFMCVYTFISNDAFHNKYLLLIGQHSLEIYYIHCFFVRYVVPVNFGLFSGQGLFILVLYFTVVMFLTFVVIKIVYTSRFLTLVLWGKTIS